MLPCKEIVTNKPWRKKTASIHQRCLTKIIRPLDITRPKSPTLSKSFGLVEPSESSNKQLTIHPPIHPTAFDVKTRAVSSSREPANFSRYRILGPMSPVERPWGNSQKISRKLTTNKKTKVKIVFLINLMIVHLSGTEFRLILAVPDDGISGSRWKNLWSSQNIVDWWKVVRVCWQNHDQVILMERGRKVWVITSAKNIFFGNREKWTKIRKYDLSFLRKQLHSSFSHVVSELYTYCCKSYILFFFKF